MNMRHDTPSSNDRLNEHIEFFVSSDSELQMTWCYAFDSEITGGVAWQSD